MLPRGTAQDVTGRPRFLIIGGSIFAFMGGWSHSLGMLLFGAAAVWLDLNIDHVEVARSELAIPIIIGLIYVLLSVRFWFNAPAVGYAVATACFTVARWSS